MPPDEGAARAAATAAGSGLCSDVPTAPYRPRPAGTAATGADGPGLRQLSALASSRCLEAGCRRCSPGTYAAGAELWRQRLSGPFAAIWRVPQKDDSGTPRSANAALDGWQDWVGVIFSRIRRRGSAFGSGGLGWPRPPHHRRDRSGAHSVTPGAARAAATAAGSVSASTATGTEGTRAAAASGFGIVHCRETGCRRCSAGTFAAGAELWRQRLSGPLAAICAVRCRSAP